MSERIGAGVIGVGVIGAGVISEVYLDYLAAAPEVEVLAIGDVLVDRAREVADRHGVSVGGSAAAVLEHPDVQIVVNLTIPAAHAEISLAAIARGKHVWSEKPIALSTTDAAAILHAASERGVRVGVAPDTLLGAAFGTALAAIADGSIGRPLFAQAAIQNIGPDWWHPAPEFLFARGAGPVLDMGPYYLTALARVFGPAVDVVAVGQRPQSQRVIRSGPRAGESFEVEVDSTVSAIVRYASGAHAQILFSFDSPLRRAGFLEVTGSSATLELPDPNRFDGVTRILRAGESEWSELAPTPEPTPEPEARGLGVRRIARSLLDESADPTAPDLAAHVLEVLLAIEEAARSDSRVAITSTFAAPQA